MLLRSKSLLKIRIICIFINFQPAKTQRISANWRISKRPMQDLTATVADPELRRMPGHCALCRVLPMPIAHQVLLIQFLTSCMRTWAW